MICSNCGVGQVRFAVVRRLCLVTATSESGKAVRMVCKAKDEDEAGTLLQAHMSREKPTSVKIDWIGEWNQNQHLVGLFRME